MYDETTQFETRPQASGQGPSVSPETGAGSQGAGAMSERREEFLARAYAASASFSADLRAVALLQEAGTRTTWAEIDEDEREEIALALDDTPADDDEADGILERFREQFQEGVLSCDLTITVDVLLGTGGPARGIEIDFDADEYNKAGGCWQELEPVEARFWYCDWWQARHYTKLTGEELSALMGLL